MRRNRIFMSISLVLLSSVALLLTSCGGDDNPIVVIEPPDPELRQLTTLSTAATWEKVWGLGPGSIFAVGEDGLAYLYDGVTWNQLPTTVKEERTLHGAWGVATNDAYVVGFEASVLDSVPSLTVVENYNGVDFENRAPGGIFIRLTDVWGSGPNDIWAVGDKGRIIHFDGVAWSVELAGDGNIVLRSVWGSSATDVWVAGDASTLLHWDGIDSTWTWINTKIIENFKDVWGFSDSLIYVTGSGGYIFSLTGPDDSVTVMETPTTDDVYSIWGVADNDLWAVGETGLILQYDGVAWTDVPSGTDYTFLSVWGSSATDIYAVGQATMHYDGTSWEFFELRRMPHFNDVWGENLAVVLAVGSGGAILSSNTGIVFTEEASGVTEDLHAVWSDPNSGVHFAAGDNGILLSSDGLSWLVETHALVGDFRGLDGFSDTALFVVGSGGLIGEYDGALWNDVSGVTLADLNDVWVDQADSLAIAVGRGGTIVRRSSSGVWSADVSGVSADLSSVWGFDDGVMYAAGAGGVLLRYANGNWATVAVPAAAGVDLSGGWGDSESAMIVVGADGLALYWNGSSWEQLLTDVTVDFNAVYGTSSTNVYVVGAANHMLLYSR